MLGLVLGLGLVLMLGLGSNQSSLRKLFKLPKSEVGFSGSFLCCFLECD